MLNPWFGFQGGKGLGVTAGVTAIAWPPGLLVVLPSTAIGARLLRAAGGALVGLATYVIGAVLWATYDWPNAWGLDTDDRLVWLAIGVITLTVPKFVGDLNRRRGAGSAN